MADTLLQMILRLLHLVESPVIGAAEAAAYPEEELDTLVSAGILFETGRATEIPRPARYGPGGGLAVRETARGLYGVAEDEDDFTTPVPLTPEDVRQYGVSAARLAAAVRRENDIAGSGFQIDGGIVPLGVKRLDGVGAVTVYLSLPNADESALLARCHRLKSGASSGRTAVIMPRCLPLSPEAQRILDGIQMLDLSAADGLRLDWQAAFPAAQALGKGPNYLFRKQGQGWRLVFEGREIIVQDAKGMDYIAELLRHAGSPVLAAELFVGVSGAQGLPVGSAGEILDSTAMTSYRARAADLQLRVAEAEKNNDPIRKEHLQTEMEKLTDEILAARGLGGRLRKSQDDREKFRKSVFIAIGRSIKLIRKHLPSLADHLSRHIETGNFLLYSGNLPWEF
ncbi:MAG: hypothetical protein LC126_24200 [Bryobacterales bacterium]|nr:hypothetical protein [Bryobacterales bacterium]